MSILTRTLAAATALTFAVATPATVAHAQAPNFSGQWELNAAKSDFGPIAAQAPSKITMTVTQTATTMKVAQEMTVPSAGNMSVTSQYALDGTPTSSTGPDGGPIVSTAKFDGATLAIQSKISVGADEATRISRWTLAPDGKSLTVEQNLMMAQGPIAMKVVFDKK